MISAPTTAAVPARYRGVWQRTLLETPALRDISTTVFWLQTAGWHADLRIPADRPDFSGVSSLAACSPAQLAWLAQQQGFAGCTEVTEQGAAHTEVCTWHRRVDFQPPAAGPDAGIMQFEPQHLVETGLYGSYLEHWQPLPNAVDGHAVLGCSDGSEDGSGDGQGAQPTRLLLVAGDFVMHVRPRMRPWPAAAVPGTALAALPVADLAALLDFEISFGRRTATGWRITHSTLPWLESTEVRLSLDRSGPEHATVTWNEVPALWQVLEWALPASP